MKKRWCVCSFIAVLTSAALLAGCGTAAPGTETGSAEAAPEQGAPEKTVIRFQTWNPGEGEPAKALEEAFEAAHPDIDVQFVYMPYTDHVEKLKVDLAAGDAADVYGVQTGAMYKEFRDFEEDLAPYMQEEYGEDWVSVFNEYAMTLLRAEDGKYYGLPLGLTYSGTAWANMKIMDKYGLSVPASYDDLLKASAVLRENGEYPLAIGAKDDWINIDTFFSIATDINSEKFYSALEGEVPFTDPEIVQALQIWQSCFTEGIFQDGALGVGMYNDTTDMYQKEGSIPMILNGSWACGAFTEKDEQTYAVYNSEDSHHEVFLIDWNGDGRPAPVGEAVDVSLAINSQSPNKDAAWRFVDWMIHDGAEILVNKYLAYCPARTDMKLDVEGLSENGQACLDYIVENGATNVAGYREMAYPELKEEIQTELKELAIGDITPETAAEAIETASKAQER